MSLFLHILCEFSRFDADGDDWISVKDLLASLQNDFRPDGSISDQTNLTSFGVLALRAAGVPPPGRTRHWLVRQADSDGGLP